MYVRVNSPFGNECNSKSEYGYRDATFGNEYGQHDLRIDCYEPEKKKHGGMTIPHEYVNQATTYVDKDGSIYEYKFGFDEKTWCMQLQITKTRGNVIDEYSFHLQAFGRVRIVGGKHFVIRMTNGNLKFPLPSQNLIWYAGESLGMYDEVVQLIVICDGELLVCPYSLPIFGSTGAIRNSGNIQKTVRDILTNRRPLPLATGPHRKAVHGFLTQIPRAIKQMDGIDIQKVLNIVEKKRDLGQKKARQRIIELGARALSFLLL